MKHDNAQTYVVGVGDQIAAAVARRNAEEVGRILDQVDADGYQQAAVILAQGVARTSLGPAMAEPPLSTTDPVDVTTNEVMADALRLSVDRLVALSRAVDNQPANVARAARDPQLVTQDRIARLVDEAAVSGAAFHLALACAADPRKHTHGSMSSVEQEVLALAATALGVYEHLTGHMGYSFAALFGHIEATYQQAGLDTPGGDR